MGEFYLRHVHSEAASQSNRGLLMTSCHNPGLCIINTYFEHPPDEQVTYFDMETQPMQDLSNKGFGQLDFILTERHNLNQITDAYSNRSAALQSHFSYWVHTWIVISRNTKSEAEVSERSHKQTRVFSQQQMLAINFIQIFHHQMHNFSETATSDIIEDNYTAINHALLEAASK